MRTIFKQLGGAIISALVAGGIFVLATAPFISVQDSGQIKETTFFEYVGMNVEKMMNGHEVELPSWDRREKPTITVSDIHLYEKAQYDPKVLFKAADADGTALDPRIAYIEENEIIYDGVSSPDMLKGDYKVATNVLQPNGWMIFPHAGFYRVMVEVTDAKGVVAKQLFTIPVDYVLPDMEPAKLKIVSFTQEFYKRTFIKNYDEYISFTNEQPEYSKIDERIYDAYQGANTPEKVIVVPGFHTEPKYHVINGSEVIKTYYEPDDICRLHVTTNLDYDNTIELLEGTSFNINKKEISGKYKPIVYVNGEVYNSGEITINNDLLGTTVEIYLEYSDFPSSWGYEAIYDGKEHSISVNPTDSKSTVLYSLDGKNYDPSPIVRKNPCNLTVYFRVKTEGREDYQGYEHLYITYGRPNVSASNIDVPYDAKNHCIAVNTSPSVAAPFSPTITYSETKDGDYSADNIYKTDVKGNEEAQTIYYRVEAEGWETVEGSATITIRRIDPIVTVTTTENTSLNKKTFIHPGGTLDVGFFEADGRPHGIANIVASSPNNITCKVNASINNNGQAVTSLKYTDPCTVTASFTTGGDNNYKVKTGNITFKIENLKVTSTPDPSNNVSGLCYQQQGDIYINFDMGGQKMPYNDAVSKYRMSASATSDNGSVSILGCSIVNRNGYAAAKVTFKANFTSFSTTALDSPLESVQVNQGVKSACITITPAGTNLKPEAPAKVNLSFGVHSMSRNSSKDNAPHICEKFDMFAYECSRCHCLGYDKKKVHHSLRKVGNTLDAAYSNRLDVSPNTRVYDPSTEDYVSPAVTAVNGYNKNDPDSYTLFYTHCVKCHDMFTVKCVHETSGGQCWKCHIPALTIGNTEWSTQAQIDAFPGDWDTDYCIIDDDLSTNFDDGDD